MRAARAARCRPGGLSSYACRPYRYGSAEVRTHERADGAVLELMLRGYSQEASSFELAVTWK